jgi:hypothetical protein
VPLPRRGTFQDVLLQEVDYRERNLRFAEVSIFAAMRQNMLLLTADMLHTDGKKIVEIKKKIFADTTKILDSYEAEIFQDRYLPEYQRHMRELSRREKAEAEAKRQRDLEALGRVAALSEDE